MQRLKLWDTLGREMTEFTPLSPDGQVRVYHCGPTVYSSPHIGNMRRFLVADLLVRALRFLGYDVRSVMNITDVGHLLDTDHEAAGTDRMVLAAQREHASPQEIAAKYTQEFFQALTLLRAEPAQYYPRATMHIERMIDITKRLLKKGRAYETSSGIYLDVTNVPHYGKLSGNTLQNVEAGARVDVREEKRHPADFALWIKAPKEHLMQWDSPWGRGYPGWHTECSAMAMQLLGETLDIHTGGEDNIFPHHENEIAQSEGATGKPFARIWLHNAHLLVNEKKMSKSEGTFMTLRDILAKGYDPLAFRLLVLQTHYRSKLNFTWESLDAAQEGLQSLRTFVRGVWRNTQTPGAHTRDIAPDLQSLRGAIAAVLADDLNSPQALALLFDFVRTMNPHITTDALPQETAHAILDTLREIDRVFAVLNVDAERTPHVFPAAIEEMLRERNEARANNNFVRADALRKAIEGKGYEVEDTPSGTRLTPKSGA